jgi:hypothetical protein
MADPDRSAAMRGNKNAAGPRKGRPSADKHGARLGIIGGLVPLGGLATGAIVGASNKSERAKSRHANTSAGFGAGGAYYVNRAVGRSKKAAAVGALMGAGISYGGAKLGQKIGKKIAER